MSRYLPTQYPVIIKQVQGYLVLACPDLEMVTTEKIENLSAEKIGSRVLQFWRRVDQAAKELSEQGEEVTPSPLPQLQTDSSMTYSVPQAASILGMSEQTLRRRLDRGGIDMKLTQGGHRKVSVKGLSQLSQEINNQT